MLNQLAVAVETDQASPGAPMAASAQGLSRYQVELARRAVLLLKSVYADVSALRVDEGDSFQGTGSCEYGHEGVDVTLDWPNLAILTDQIKAFLDDVAALDRPSVWYVLHGDMTQPFRCEALNREDAMALCGNAYPGSTVHGAVPADALGDFVQFSYGEEMVHCPRCGSRTQFEDMPPDGWQIHLCQPCGNSFIAVPDEECVGDGEELDV